MYITQTALVSNQHKAKSHKQQIEELEALLSTPIPEPTDHLKELKRYRQWVVWSYILEDGTYLKVPFNPNDCSKRASVSDDSTWGSYVQARSTLRHNPQLFSGLGFVFTKEDDLCGVDLDTCRDPKSGSVEQWALDILESLDSYTEVSPSDTGLKCLVKATKPGSRCKFKGIIELYDSGRFFTITEEVYQDRPIQERQQELEEIYHILFPSKPQKPTERRGEGFKGSDKELVAKARQSGPYRELFKALYDGGDHGAVRHFSKDSDGTHSAGDFWLCWILSFWTGGDAEGIDRIFRTSKLYRENKWNRRDGDSIHGDRTIRNAIAKCDRFYDEDYEPVASQEVLAALKECMTVLYDRSWKGIAGGTDRAVFRSLGLWAESYGLLREQGIEVSASSRSLALITGVSRESVERSLQRLRRAGLIDRINKGSGRRAATYLIRRAETLHNNHIVESAYYGEELRALNKLRYRIHKRADMEPINKKCAQVIELVLLSESGLTKEQLADKLGVKRARDIKSRYLNKLCNARLLVNNDGIYTTPKNLLEKIEKYLEESGCNSKELKDRRDYEDERTKFHRKEGVS